MSNREPSVLLLQRAAGGDSDAFDLLTRRMMPLIRVQVHRHRGAGMEEEDLLQEALMGLLSAVKRFDPSAGAQFTTFATTCIRHRLTSAIRRSIPKTRIEQPLDEETAHANLQMDPALRLQEQEDAALLQKRLQERLTPLEYRVLLARLQGCSYREIAAKLHIGTKTVDNAVQRLRKKFSSAL